MNKMMSFKEILKLVLGWRLLITLIALPAMFLLAPRLRFTSLTAQPSAGNLLSTWSNFDGLYYLKLAEFGYGYQHQTNLDYTFLPVYPWVIHTFNFFRNYLISGLLLSHLALLLAFYFLYRLILLDFRSSVARLTIFLMLIFPTAFFFGSLYPESLLLLLSVLSFYLARRRQFFLAGIAASLASATGIMGIFLWPSLLYDFWLSHGKNLRSCLHPSAVWLVLPPLGLISFLRFQYLETKNSFFPALLRIAFPGQTLEKIILPHQVFFRYLKMLFFTDHLDPLFFTVTLELFCAVLILAVLILVFRKIRFSYWLFILLTFLLSNFSGSFMGLPRYTLVLFPVFISLALWLERQHPFVKILYYVFCLAGAVLSVTFFTRGYFIG